MVRQSFGDFLNSGSPSIPRGRGRGGFGRGGGGGGGGRGGRGGFTPGSSSKKSFNADYTNMGFNYEAINNQKYTKMEGFNVQPFGPSIPSTPDDRGNQTPRRGGIPKGLFQPHNRGNPNESQPQTPSGAATPVHGLGFHDEKSKSKKTNDQHDLTRSKGDHRGLGLGSGSFNSTVGKGLGQGKAVTWGGGKAPLFVKAGELFKDGEAEVITIGKDNKLHIEAYPMSDPSAPQMTHLEDETEIDIIQQASPLSPPTSSPPSSEAEEPEERPIAVEEKIDQDAEVYQEDALEALLGSNHHHASIENHTGMTGLQAVPAPVSEMLQDIVRNVSPSPHLRAELPQIFEETHVVEVVENISNVETEQKMDSQSAEDEVPLFFVDTNPDASEDADIPTYNKLDNATLGESSAAIPAVESEEEKILFVPKKYKKPEPVFINIGQLPQPERKQRNALSESESRAFVNPRAMSRAEKKAAKREKRRGRGKRSRQRKQDKAPREDSDIEWGSDGPPIKIVDVEGAESDGDEDEDIKLLRDYMRGTMLNAQTEQAEREEEMNVQDDSENIEVDEDDEEDEDAEEMDLEAMRIFGQGIKGLTDEGQEIVDDNDWQSDGSGIDEDEIEEEIDDDSEHQEDEEDSSEEDDDSSILGEIDIEGMMDSDSDEEDIEALFTGSNKWNNDTDWFIDAMEDALDGTDFNMRDRKSRKTLFKSIENGDFADDFGLRPAPTKKSIKKNKNKFVPEELQAQWEKDRLVKAEKKQQRELERLIAEIEPTLAGYSRKGKAKAKGKGKSHQAAVAHLIPASASQVADMFDISSDEEGELSLPLFRKGGRKPSGMPLDMVDDKIQIFLEDRGKTTLSLPPMGKDDRKKVHMLADCYGLGSKSKGSGKNRFTVLIKNKRSGSNINEVKIDRLLSSSQKVGGDFYKALYSRGSGKTKSKGQSGQPSIRHKDGDEVGHGADKIGQENIGHRLLSMMGWAEGDRIGRGAGLEAPIVAIVKNTKTGLGA
ncbi:uncharacterized protein L201_001152 [Kwoniella dendrophila CBS 6074]|uniref:Protein SQS1 n=1 Tax=Kwoniella dendrophila CBS 6074 TaxID=1295534 RepID=A0AAX4JLJ1_9TREE